MDIAGGESIKSLGAIVNGLNEKQTLETLKTLVSLIKKHEIRGGSVYMLGGFGSQAIFGSDAFLTLNLLGGELISDITLPEKYKVSKSPSWIIELDEGEAVLEGLLDVKKYVNSTGKFIKPLL